MRNLLVILFGQFISLITLGQEFRTLTFENAGLINKNEPIVAKYDSLHNIQIDPKGGINQFKKFIGQEIIFFKRNLSRSQYPVAYVNFECPNATKVSEDTIWHKKRKNPKPKDFTIKSVYSNKYAPRYYKNAWIVYCGASPFEYSFVENAASYTIIDETPSSHNRHTGYYTPCEEIEGKTFKIVDISKASNTETLFAIRFTLLSENGDTLYWYAKAPNSYPCRTISYPIVIKGYLDKLGKLYLNKDLYLYDVKYKCTELVFASSTGEYQIPHLIFKNDKGVEFRRLVDPPSLFSYEKSEYLLKKEFTHEEVQTQEEYESVLKWNKEMEEQRAQQMEKEKEEKERKEKVYRDKIIKKYGRRYAELILNQKVQIGMTKEMVLEAWGKPYDINKTIGNFGIHEQWCYGDNQYLYFENGKLTVIQN